MNIYKIIFLLLFTNFSTILALDNPPELVRTFFKRLSTELGSSLEWTFTTPRITTSWGSCTITDNDITVTIGNQTACWITPGGPWTVQYTSATETVSLKPQQNFIQPEWTINPPFSQENVFTNITEKLTQLSSMPTLTIPIIPKAPTISAPTISMPAIPKAPTTEKIVSDSIPKKSIISCVSSYSLPKNPKLTLQKLAYPQRFYTKDQIINAAWNWLGWRRLELAQKILTLSLPKLIIMHISTIYKLKIFYKLYKKKLKIPFIFT